MKAKLSLLSLAVCAAFGASSAFAQSGTITFNGVIQSANCTPTLNGGAATSTVNLPQATVTQLSTAGNFTGDTDFTIGLAAECAAGNSGNFWAFFSAANAGSGQGGVDSGTGRIITNKPSLHLRLRDGNNNIIVAANNAPVPSTAPGTGQGDPVPVGTNNGQVKTGTKTYTVQYFANAALVDADAGGVETSVKYNIVFY